MALIKAEIELEKACKEMLKGSDRLRIYGKWETRFKNKKLAEIMPVFYRAMARIQQQLTEVNGRLTVKNANLQQLTTHNTKSPIPLHNVLCYDKMPITDW